MPGSNGEVQPLWQLWQQHAGERLWWGKESWLWFPARTILLEPGAILIMTLISSGLAWISVQLLPVVFMDVAQQPQITKQRSSPRHQQRFTSGVIRSAMLKEWRILLRSTRFRIIAACLNGVVILEVLIFSYAPDFSQTFDLFALFALLILYMALLTTKFFIQVSCAQGQDLKWLGSAPATALELQLSKGLTVLLMVWGMCIPMVGAIAFAHGPALLMTLLLLPMTTYQAILSMWHANVLTLTPQNPPALGWTARDGLLSYLEFFSILGWPGLAACLYFQYWWYGGAIALLLVAVMAISYQRSHRLENKADI